MRVCGLHSVKKHGCYMYLNGFGVCVCVYIFFCAVYAASLLTHFKKGDGGRAISSSPTLLVYSLGALAPSAAY